MNTQKYTTVNSEGEIIGHYVLILTFDIKGNVLLLLRKDTKRWEPPKGGIDVVNGQPESSDKAAIREFREETGLSLTFKLERLTEFYDTVYKSHARKKLIHATIYRCRLKETKPIITINADSSVEADHTEYNWVALSNLDNYDLYQDNFRVFLKKYC